MVSRAWDQAVGAHVAVGGTLISATAVTCQKERPATVLIFQAAEASNLEEVMHITFDWIDIKEPWVAVWVSGCSLKDRM